jgi:hypothetical protein
MGRGSRRAPPSAPALAPSSPASSTPSHRRQLPLCAACVPPAHCRPVIVLGASSRFLLMPADSPAIVLSFPWPLWESFRLPLCLDRLPNAPGLYAIFVFDVEGVKPPRTGLRRARPWAHALRQGLLFVIRRHSMRSDPARVRRVCHIFGTTPRSSVEPLHDASRGRRAPDVHGPRYV